MDQPGVSFKGGSPSGIRGAYNHGIMHVIEIDESANLDGSFDLKRGTVMVLDTDNSAWVVADAVRMNSGTAQQDARNVRILARDILGVDAGHKHCEAYEEVVWSDARTLFCNNPDSSGDYGLFAQADEDLFNQRIRVWKSNEA